MLRFARDSNEKRRYPTAPNVQQQAAPSWPFSSHVGLQTQVEIIFGCVSIARRSIRATFFGRSASEMVGTARAPQRLTVRTKTGQECRRLRPHHLVLASLILVRLCISSSCAFPLLRITTDAFRPCCRFGTRFSRSNSPPAGTAPVRFSFWSLAPYDHDQAHPPLDRVDALRLLCSSIFLLCSGRTPLPDLLWA